MKKTTAILISVLIVLMLCACGKSGVVSVTTEPAPSAQVSTESTPEVESTPDVVEDSTEDNTPDTGLDAQAQELFEKAQALKGEDIEKLYEAIGYPQSSDYAPSCLAQGGQDGELLYDGFVVISFKNGDTEVVYEVLTNGEYFG